MAAQGSAKVVAAALAGNLAIAITKFVAYGATRSTAMLTEAIHSLVDTGDQALLLIGQRRAARPADERHPFGYGLESYFWSFVVALMIFLVGGVISIWQGAHKLMNMEPLERPWISLAVLAASMVFEGLSFRVAYREYRGVVRGREAPLWRFLRESKDPSLFATLMEDGAALIGLAIAAAGVVASGYLGALWADGVASICIGVLLVLIAAFLANETRSLIAGEAAAGPVTERLRAAAAASDELGELADFKTLQLGPNAILVATGWRFPPELEGRALAAAVERLRARLCEADPRTAQVLLAPAKTGPAEV